MFFFGFVLDFEPLEVLELDPLDCLVLGDLEPFGSLDFDPAFEVREVFCLELFEPSDFLVFDVLDLELFDCLDLGLVFEALDVFDRGLFILEPGAFLVFLELDPLVLFDFVGLNLVSLDLVLGLDLELLELLELLDFLGLICFFDDDFPVNFFIAW